MSEPLAWGILGTGNIARKFAAQLPQTERARLVAVGSRRQSSADDFAGEFPATGYGSYADLLSDAAVEAVYLSLPNSMHGPWTLRALEAGKHVLCEKPMATSAAEAETMFDAAAAAGRTLVEAFMYRCHPAIRQIIAMVHDGAVGRLKIIRSHFTFNREARASDVRYQPELAGGSLMDVGCYTINFARALAGREPVGCHALTHQHELGVDDYAVGTLDFGDGLLACFSCGMTVEADRTTVIAGSDGYLAIDTPWFTDGEFTLVRGDGRRQTFHEPAAMGLYALEADRFAAVVRDGAEPPLSRADTVGNLRVLDALRA